MTKQDNITRIGPMEVGKGFPINKPNQPNVYPPDLFTSFVNLSTNNEIVVRRFCIKYKIVPRNIENGWLNGFLKEQSSIKEILNRIIKNNISKVDIDKINLEIENIKTQLKLTKGEKLTKINEELTNLRHGEGDIYFSSLKESKKILFPMEIKRYPNTISILYEELAKILLKKRVVKVCPGCGRFVIPNKGTPWQRFCEDINCKEKYHARKKYYRKKGAKKT